MALGLTKGYVVTGQAYFFNKATKELLMIVGGHSEPVKLRKVKKMVSDNAHKVLVDFLALPEEEQIFCYGVHRKSNKLTGV